MTSEELDREVGAMVRSHSDNEKIIACIETRLKSFQTRLAQFLEDSTDTEAGRALANLHDPRFQVQELLKRLQDRADFQDFFQKQGLQIQ